ncbi:MAG: hypothetical protein PGN15_12075, partial [Aeromicrobium erythreum]
LLMLVAAVDAVLTTARSSFEPGWFAVLTRAAVGLFAGWVTAAFYLNLSTALVDLEVVSAQSVGWQLGVLAGGGGDAARGCWCARAGTWPTPLPGRGRCSASRSRAVPTARPRCSSPPSWPGVAIVLTAAALLARRRA